MRAAVLAALLLLSVSVAVADTDPPDDPALAVPVTEGTITGTLSATDRADWFRLELPPGHGALFAISSDRHDTPSVRVLTDDMSRTLGSGNPLSNGGTLLAGAGGAVRIGVVLTNATGGPDTAWSLSIRIVPVADVRVVGANVEFLGVGGSSDVLGAPGFQRRLTIDVANDGAAASDAWALLHTNGRFLLETGEPDDDGTDLVRVPPGGTAALVWTWTDSCMMDARIDFSVMASADGDRGNNAGSVDLVCPV